MTCRAYERDGACSAGHLRNESKVLWRLTREEPDAVRR
jgi:hypothetical protein